MTQNDRILRHLREVGGITSAEAMTEYGVYRLASRISDLRRMGYDIEKETVKAKNRYGEPTAFARYTMKQEEIHNA